MIEAQKAHEKALKSFCEKNPNASYALSAAGDDVGEIWFDDSDLFGGLASKERSALATSRVPMTTIDNQITSLELKGPYCIKLDTHGFEKSILAGAPLALQDCALLVIECYNFHLTRDCLTFYQMCLYLEERGFRPIDLAEPMWRRHDSAFWQLDLFFIKSTRTEFLTNAYE